MTSSLTSSLSSTISSASLRRSSLLPTVHHHPNSLSLTKPTTNFPSIKAQMSEGVNKMGEGAGDIWKEGQKTATELAGKAADGAVGVKDTVVEKSLDAKKSVVDAGNAAAARVSEETKKAVDTVTAAKDQTVKAAGDASEATTKRVSETVNAAKGGK
ncbi:hypothetical protein L6452_35491 [Arctium lappa]|uniref:Uncharacterized protein n=1 Tax=Arctium lappa TaxID=4217 RepID=A0ACB8Y742_ARCLA|nr:hypothetical protein L6452_35491 [Arctium lappa]